MAAGLNHLAASLDHCGACLATLSSPADHFVLVLDKRCLCQRLTRKTLLRWFGVQGVWIIVAASWLTRACLNVNVKASSLLGRRWRAIAVILLCNVQTWLILPVVICLSQRLSHACLSMNHFTVKLHMAHLNIYSLFEIRSLHGYVSVWIALPWICIWLI